MENSVHGHAGQLARPRARCLLGVIADDFTGAADAALPFAERGLRTVVCLGVEGLASAPEGYDVLSLDLATRHLPAQEAAASVRQAVNRLRDEGVRVLYKKIDSTMRGNPGAEIEAALSASTATRAVVCPAFPAMGRTVVGGAVRVHGVDLLQAAMRSDVRSTVRSSRVADVLRAQTSLAVCELTRPDPVKLRSRTEKRIVVADALSDDDLDAWVGEFGMTPRILWVGSAGLASALSRALPASEKGSGTEQDIAQTDQALMVVGSAHPASRRQIETVLTSSDAVGIPVSPSELCSDIIRTDQVAERAVEVLRRGQSCVLYVEGGEGDGIAAYSGAEEEIALRLATIAARVQMDAGSCTTLVLTGGDTARAVLHEMGVECLVVAGAIAPGIPVLNPVGRDLRIVTKAGGFGEPDALVCAMRSVRRGERT